MEKICEQCGKKFHTGYTNDKLCYKCYRNTRNECYKCGKKLKEEAINNNWHYCEKCANEILNEQEAKKQC